MRKDDYRALKILERDLIDALGGTGDYQFAVRMLLSRLESWGEIKMEWEEDEA